MSKYFPALILVAMVALAAFAADVWNVGVASVDTSGNAIFGGNVTATGGITVASFKSTGISTNDSLLVVKSANASNGVFTASAQAASIVLSTGGVAHGTLKVVNGTNLSYIVGTVTNVLDADTGTP